MRIWATIKSFPIILITSVIIITGCSSNDTAKREIKEYVYPSPPDQARFYFDRMLRSSQNVEFETEDQQISRYLTGSTRKADGMLKPFDIAVHKGRIFVSDPAMRKIHIFDVREFHYSVTEPATDSTLTKPFGIDVDAVGNLYVIDSGAGDIKIYDRDGKYLRKIGNKELFSMPTGLAVSKDGTRVYISDTGGVSTQEHHILEFDVQSGELLRTIGTRGKGDLEFNLPKDIALDDEKNHLYVVDSGNFRVQVIDLNNGTLVRQFGKIGRQLGNFSRPKGIDIDKDKNVYVSDAAFGNFQIFNPEGQLLMFIGERGNQIGPGVYMLNSGLTIDEDGRVLIADQYHRKVDVFRPAALSKTDGYLGLIENLTEEEYKKLKAEIDAKKAATKK
ncbi:hypothetical protein A9Q98_08430 [Thalassotalea sp. 42_200_T64]|nr:hypothetical protein A9Q98_08430 [Thalassotalea sp. 42_200_T64]